MRSLLLTHAIPGRIRSRRHGADPRGHSGPGLAAAQPFSMNASSMTLKVLLGVFTPVRQGERRHSGAWERFGWVNLSCHHHPVRWCG